MCGDERGYGDGEPGACGLLEILRKLRGTGFMGNTQARERRFLFRVLAGGRHFLRFGQP
jgi:hypothetical protein